MKTKHRFVVAHRAYDTIRNFPVKVEVACIFHQDCKDSMFMTDAYYYPTLDMVSIYLIKNINAKVVPVKIQRQVYLDPDGSIHRIEPNFKSLKINLYSRDFSNDPEYFDEVREDAFIGIPIFNATDDAITYKRKDGSSGILKTGIKFTDDTISDLAFQPKAKLYADGKLIMPPYWWRDYINIGGSK